MPRSEAVDLQCLTTMTGSQKAKAAIVKQASFAGWMLAYEAGKQAVGELHELSAMGIGQPEEAESIQTVQLNHTSATALHANSRYDVAVSLEGDRGIGASIRGAGRIG